MVGAALRSREFLQPWEPTWPADDLTRAAFRRRLTAYARDIDDGAAYPFFVFRAEDGALVGGVTLSNVRRGVAQMGSMGYWCRPALRPPGPDPAAPSARSRLRLRHAGPAPPRGGLHPGQRARRANLLIKAGFAAEGQAQAYLKINGDWRDHLLFGARRATCVRPG